MADAKRRRKFKCPNCDHMVKFEINPERTLIACDHCGQLTRVTMKTSESLDDGKSSSRRQDAKNIENDNTSGASSTVMSQAFEDLDLEGLEHRDSVASSTLGSVDLKGRQPKSPNHSKKQNPQINPVDKTIDKGKSKANSPQSTMPETDQSSAEGNVPDVGLGAPLPPPYVPTNLQTDRPKAAASPNPPSPDSDSEAPITFSDTKHGNRFFAATPTSADETSETELNLSGDVDDMGSAEQTAEPGDHFLATDAVSWMGEATSSADVDSPLDLNYLDPISEHGEITSRPEQVEEQLEILEGMEILDGGPNLASEEKSIRIICKVCDTLSYFPPAEEYVCQDCYSRINEDGVPIRAKKQPTAPRSTLQPGDEIDDLISTAIDDDQPTQESIWQSEKVDPSFEDDEIIEDTTGLLDEDSEEDDSELRLAPLDDPTDDYRESVMPHGFKDNGNPTTTRDLESDDAAAEPTKRKLSTNDDDIIDLDEIDELPELLPDSEQLDNAAPLDLQQDAEASTTDDSTNDNASGAPQEIFSWKNDSALVEELANPRSSIDPNQPLREDESSPANSDTHERNPRDSSSSLDADSPVVTHSDIQTSANSLFIDGGDYKSPVGPNASESPTQPEQMAGRNKVTPPVPPPFIPPESQIMPSESLTAPPSPDGFHAYRDSKPKAAEQPKTEPQDDGPVSPLEYGWMGNWMPLLSSVWVLGGFAVVSLGIALSLWLASVFGAETSSTVARVAAVVGGTIVGIPTAMGWVWLFSVIVDQKHNNNSGSLFEFNRMVVHAIRLSVCFGLCLPGLLIGTLAGFPIFGILVALFYTSPVALYLNTISQYFNRPIVFYSKSFADQASKQQDLWLSGIGMVGMAMVVTCPFLVLASYVPFPGVFLAGPALVLFSVVLGLQVVRLTETMKVLNELEDTTRR